MQEKSLLDYGFDVLSSRKDPITFIEFFNEVVKLAGLVDLSDAEKRTKMSKFYTQLSLDGRFLTLEDGKWDLQSRHVFEQVNLDLIDAYSDDEGEVDDEEQKLLKEELGEVDEESEEDDSDDLDFDKPQQTDEDEDL